MLRWLLPLIAVMTLLASSVTAWAAAGFIGESECCCPVKKDCKCHDHEDDRPSAPTMKRCGGKAIFAAPAQASMVAAVEPPSELVAVVDIVVTTTAQPIPDDITFEPETPPF